MIADSLGFAIGLLIMLALALFGATLAPGRWAVRERWRTRAAAAAIIAGVALAFGWNSLSARRAIDLSPRLPEPNPVAGEWRDGGATVTFEPGDRYVCRGVPCTGMGTQGAWRRVGPYGVVVRWNDGHEVTWRIVTYRGDFRLGLLPLEGDVGPMDGRLFYTKVQ